MSQPWNCGRTALSGEDALGDVSPLSRLKNAILGKNTGFR